MGYILDLRKITGHRPLIMTCAGVLIVNRKKELLLERRADNGLWAYPGGSMELGESFESCARREVLEETGLCCGKLTHYMNLSGDDVHFVYPNGDEIYAAEEVFLCEDFSGECRAQNSEVSELHFFAPEDLPEKHLLTPNNVIPILRFQKEYKKQKQKEGDVYEKK